MIKLKKGDTPIDEMIYGKRSYPIVNGKVLERDYNDKYCRICSCRIEASHKDKREGKYRLETTSELNKRILCHKSPCIHAYRASISKTARDDGFNYENKHGYPLLRVEKAEANRIASRIANYIINL